MWVSFWRAPNSHSFEGLNQIQDVDPKIEKWNTKLIWNLCMNYMVHVSSTMWRIQNQPSNTLLSRSDNALRLLVLLTDRLHRGLKVTSSLSILGLCFERLFLERYLLKGQIMLEGHWQRLQSFEHWPRRRVELNFDWRCRPKGMRPLLSILTTNSR